MNISNETKNSYENIWWAMPNRQNRFSSSWWFFLLLVKGKEGYGPRQIMYSITSIVGERHKVNGKWYKGRDKNRPVKNNTDTFNGLAFGWDADRQSVKEFEDPGRVVLNRGKSIQVQKEKHSSSIKKSKEKELGMDVEIKRDKETASFTAYSDSDSYMTNPYTSMDLDTMLGGAHNITWPKLRFEGEFNLKNGSEKLEGCCFFQRICLNIPVIPWKWMITTFQDGSTFLAFIPYLGPQIFSRKKDLEDSHSTFNIPLKQSAVWESSDGKKSVKFERLRIKPVENKNRTKFHIIAINEEGDQIKFTAKPYNVISNYLESPIIKNSFLSHYTHKEYLIEAEDLEGKIQGDYISNKNLGKGYGNLEYTWGLGL